MPKKEQYTIEPTDSMWYPRMVGWASVIMFELTQKTTKKDRDRIRKMAREWRTTEKEHDEWIMRKVK